MVSLTPPTRTFSRRYVVDMFISPSQLQAYYAGAVDQVSARDRNGVRVQFPLQSLRAFVGHAGIRGTFVLSVDRSNKLLSVEKLSV